MCCNVIIRIKQRVCLTSAAQAATNQPWASAPATADTCTDQITDERTPHTCRKINAESKP